MDEKLITKQLQIKLNSNLEVGDRVILNCEIREFHVDKYFDDSQSYSFNNIQLVLPRHNSNIIVNDILPCYAPIILSTHEEIIMKIEVENNRKIGYTKSFRIDLVEAIENREIITDNHSDKERVSKNKEIFENFLENLIDCNSNYAFGLITKLERKSKLLDTFQNLYRKIFHEELRQIREEQLILSDEDFFSNSWQRSKYKNELTVRKERIKNITFFWTIPPPEFSWYHEFILEGIRRNLDKKINFKHTFSGIYLSKEKYSDSSKCHATVKIQISHKNDLSVLTETSDLIFCVELWGKNKGIKKIETKNLWQNVEFMKILETVIESPTC